MCFNESPAQWLLIAASRCTHQCTAHLIHPSIGWHRLLLQSTDGSIGQKQYWCVYGLHAFRLNKMPRNRRNDIAYRVLPVSLLFSLSLSWSSLLKYFDLQATQTLVSSPSISNLASISSYYTRHPATLYCTARIGSFIARIFTYVGATNRPPPGVSDSSV